MGKRKKEDSTRSLTVTPEMACDAGHRAHEKYQHLLAAIPDLVFHIRRDGTYLDFHAPDASRLWLKPRDFLGKRIADIFPVEFSTMCQGYIERTLNEGGVHTFEYRGQGENSNEWWEVRMTRFAEDEVLALTREVTDRKTAEEELRSRERFLRLIFESAVDPLWDWDVVNDRAVFSPSWPKMLGFELDEYDPTVHTWDSVLHPEDEPHVRAVLDRCLRGEIEEYEAEYRVRHCSGIWKWAYSRGRMVERGPNGEPLRMVGSIRDMTDRRRAEEAIREHERFLSTLMSNLPGCAYRCKNDKNWPFEYVSEGIEAITGYPPSAYMEEDGQLFAEHIHEDDRERVYADTESAVNRRQPFQLTYRVRDANGEMKWLWEQGRAVVNDAGKVVAIEGFMSDITPRKMVEEDLRRSEELQRVLLRELDHRVRNNLASLVALVDISSGGAKTVQDLASAIRSRVQAMATTHSLLAGSQLSPLDLRRLIAALIPPDVSYSVELSGPEVFVSSRQCTAVGMVIQEIATNSIKYGSLSALGGRVEADWNILNEPEPKDLIEVEFCWREVGGPAIHEAPTPGVGTTLIKGLLRAELGGQAELNYPTSGASHRLLLRLDPTEPQDFRR